MLLATTTALGWDPDSSHAREYRFGVFYGGERVGVHTFEVLTTPAAARVRSRAEFTVKVLFVPVYRYRHRAEELWRDGCLIALKSATDDNGTRSQVDAVHPAAGAAAGAARDQRILPGDCPASFAYWDLARLRGESLINAQTGDAVSVDLSPQPPLGAAGEFAGERALRYRLAAGELGAISLWYRASDGQWLGLRTRRGDGELEYRLERAGELRDAELSTTEALPAPSV